MKEQILSFLIFVSNESKLKINQVHTSFEHYSYHQQIYESRAWDKRKKFRVPMGKWTSEGKKKTLTWPLTDSTRARTRCRTLTTFMAISLPVCLSTPT